MKEKSSLILQVTKIATVNFSSVTQIVPARRSGRACSSMFTTTFDRILFKIMFYLISFQFRIFSIFPPTTNETVHFTARRGLRGVRRVFKTERSFAARVGRSERPRRPEERWSVRDGKTGGDHSRQQLHDQVVRREWTFQKQRCANNAVKINN